MNFNCKICNYSCEDVSQWNTHIQTLEHKTLKGKKSQKTTNKECEICGYVALVYSGVRTHYLSKHGSKEEKVKEFPYYCTHCDFGTFGKSIYVKHLQLKKHIQCTQQNKYKSN